jgi:hypothetical protein
MASDRSRMKNHHKCDSGRAHPLPTGRESIPHQSQQSHDLSDRRLGTDSRPFVVALGRLGVLMAATVTPGPGHTEAVRVDLVVGLAHWV